MYYIYKGRFIFHASLVMVPKYDGKGLLKNTMLTVNRVGNQVNFEHSNPRL